MNSDEGSLNAVRTRQNDVGQMEAKSTSKQKCSTEDSRNNLQNMYKTCDVIWIGNLGNDEDKSSSS